MIRQGVILAAGMGQRIRNGDGDPPKPLQSVAGLTLIKRTILTLGYAGIDRVCVVVGFKGDEICAALTSDPDYAGVGIRVSCVTNPDFEKSNGVSLLTVRGHVQGPFVLSMADHVYDPVLPRLAAASDLDDADLVLCVDRRIGEIYDIEDATKVRTADGRIVRIGKTLTNYDAIDCGVFAIGPEFLDCLAAVYDGRGDCSLSDGVQQLAVSERAHVVDIGEAFWQDVDTVGAKMRAEREILRRFNGVSPGLTRRPSISLAEDAGRARPEALFDHVRPRAQALRSRAS